MDKLKFHTIDKSKFISRFPFLNHLKGKPYSINTCSSYSLVNITINLDIYCLTNNYVETIFFLKEAIRTINFRICL